MAVFLLATFSLLFRLTPFKLRTNPSIWIVDVMS